MGFGGLPGAGLAGDEGKLAFKMKDHRQRGGLKKKASRARKVGVGQQQGAGLAGGGANPLGLGLRRKPAGARWGAGGLGRGVEGEHRADGREGELVVGDVALGVHGAFGRGVGAGGARELISSILAPWGVGRKRWTPMSVGRRLEGTRGAKSRQRMRSQGGGGAGWRFGRSAPKVGSKRGQNKKKLEERMPNSGQRGGGWMGAYASARDRALKERLPSEEEFARLWAQGVNERLRELEGAGALQGIWRSGGAGAAGARAEPFALRGMGPALWGERAWGVRFFSARKQGSFTVSESWEWGAARRLWGLPGLPAWASALICKPRAKKMGGRAWGEERLERALEEALAVYARKDALAAGLMEDHPAAVRAALEAQALGEATRSDAPLSGKSGGRGRL